MDDRSDEDSNCVRVESCKGICISTREFRSSCITVHCFPVDEGTNIVMSKPFLVVSQLVLRQIMTLFLGESRLCRALNLDLGWIMVGGGIDNGLLFKIFVTKRKPITHHITHVTTS